MSVRDAFRIQSNACDALGSPFMARLMTLFADRLEPGSVVADAVLSWQGDPLPSADSVPLRLAGALHALALQKIALVPVYPPNEVSDDDLWQAVSAALEDQADAILHWLKSPPQTNEVRRSAVLLAALSKVRQQYPGHTIDLLELGASAGLNLRADRFRLDLPGLLLGDPDSAVQLRPDWTGPLPFESLPEVASRRGVDMAPIAPGGAAGRLRLMAYVWADQQDRLTRTEHAIALAKTIPAVVDQGDAGAWLAAEMPKRTGNLPVVFHTIAWQYFPDATAQMARAAMQSATAPVVEIGMEADGDSPGAAVTLTHWPEGRIEALGRADFHGRWIDWY